MPSYLAISRNRTFLTLGLEKRRLFPPPPPRGTDCVECCVVFWKECISCISVGIQLAQWKFDFLGNWIYFHSHIFTSSRSFSSVPSAPGFVPFLCFLIVYSVRFLASGSLQSSVPFIYLLLPLLLLLLAVHGWGRPWVVAALGAIFAATQNDRIQGAAKWIYWTKKIIFCSQQILSYEYLTKYKEISKQSWFFLNPWFLLGTDQLRLLAPVAKKHSCATEWSGIQRGGLLFKRTWLSSLIIWPRIYVTEIKSIYFVPSALVQIFSVQLSAFNRHICHAQ
jgi:hypothetical protein